MSTIFTLFYFILFRRPCPRLLLMRYSRTNAYYKFIVTWRVDNTAKNWWDTCSKAQTTWSQSQHEWNRLSAVTQSGHDSHGLDAAMQRTWLCVHAVDIHIGCEEPCGKIDLIRLDWRQTFRTMPMYGLCICPVYGKFTNQMIIIVKYTANYTVMHPQRKLSKLIGLTANETVILMSLLDINRFENTVIYHCHSF